MKLSLNVADAGLTFLLVQNNVRNSQYWGGQGKVSGKNGKFPAFKGGIANFQIEVSGTYYWFPNINANTGAYFYGTYKLGVSRIKTLTVNISPSLLEANNKSPLANALQIGYNNLKLFNSDVIFGIAAQVGWSDNSSDLDSYDYRSIQSS